MSSPSAAEVWAQISRAVHLLKDLRTEATNQISLIDTGVQGLEGDNASSAAYASYRSALDAAIRQVKPIIDGHLSDLAKVIGSDSTPGSLEFWYDLAIYNQANTLTLNSRDFTYGAIAGSTGTGSVTVGRLTVDWNDLDLESCHSGTTYVDCLSDQNTGETKWREPFVLSQTTKSPDLLEDAGCGYTQTIYGQCGDNGLLQNASFQTQNLSGASITGWTSSITINDTNFTTVTSSCHRTAPEERSTATGTDTPKALTFNATATLTQKLRQKNGKLDYTRPYWLGAAWKPSTNCTASIDIKLGGKQKQLASYSGTSTNQWYYDGLTYDKYLWLPNFNADDCSVQVIVAITSGTITVDDLVCCQLTEHNGLFYHVKPLNAGGGTQTAPLRGYQRTFALSTSADSEIMKWLHLLYGIDLPTPWGVSLPTATSAGETIADPS